MPYFESVEMVKGTWVPLTSGAVASARVQNQSEGPVLIQATATNSAPSLELGYKGALRYEPGDGFDASVYLVDLFPATVASDGTAFLWGLTINGHATPSQNRVSVSHA